LSCFAGNGAGLRPAPSALRGHREAGHKAIKSNRLRTLSPYHRDRRPPKKRVQRWPAGARII